MPNNQAKKNTKTMNQADFVTFLKGAFKDDSFITLLRNALSINDIIEDLKQSKQDIIELKTSLEFAHSEVEDLKEKLSNANTVIENLSVDVKTKDKTLYEVEMKADANEQYSRRNSIRITGIPELEEGEDTDTLVTELFNTAMKIAPPLSISEIDRSHRVGKKQRPTKENPSPKPRPLLVKFISYRSKASVMKVRSRLKTVRPLPSTWGRNAFPELIKSMFDDQVNADEAGKISSENDSPDGAYSDFVPAKDRIYINDDLTRTRAKLLEEARRGIKAKKIKDAWSKDGAIIVKDKHDQVKAIQSNNDLNQCF